MSSTILDSSPSSSALLISHLLLQILPPFFRSFYFFGSVFSRSLFLYFRYDFYRSCSLFFFFLQFWFFFLRIWFFGSSSSSSSSSDTSIELSLRNSSSTWINCSTSALEVKSLSFDFVTKLELHRLEILIS